jgi:uncharacterized protein
MKKSGFADLPLHGGHVPKWLSERMAKLGFAITEAIITEYGKTEILRRLSDPFWFQSFGAVLGMDWHSSGITTSVMGALKRSVNPHAKELGIYICGGKGKYSKQTPDELLRIGEITGLDAKHLVQCSKLSAKVDNTAIQYGFQLYLHSFSATARRYHWHSSAFRSFVEEPHTGICGINQGEILNMVDKKAIPAQNGILQITAENPDRMMNEIQQLLMPHHHDVRSKDVDLRRLGSMLWLAHDTNLKSFEELLLLEGLGPRTLQSLALVSEVVHGTPSRFKDPARFSFAHGGKDGHPFPVPTKVYDETIKILKTAVDKAKIGQTDKQQAIKALTQIAQRAEKDFVPHSDIDQLIETERRDSWKYGGKTVFGDSVKPEDPNSLKQRKKSVQLRLF